MRELDVVGYALGSDVQERAFKKKKLKRENLFVMATKLHSGCNEEQKAFCLTKCSPLTKWEVNAAH